MRNKDKQKANSATYYLANRERILAREKERYRANRDKHKANCAAYRLTNAYRVALARFRATHRDQINAAVRVKRATKIDLRLNQLKEVLHEVT